MRRKLAAFILLLAAVLCLCACTGPGKNSYFRITFIDVGQGDAALIECDDRYMLIDGGGESAGDIVYNVLEQKGIQTLDILVVSHLHEDHYGGLTKALTYASSVRLAISNRMDTNVRDFDKFRNALNAEIEVPAVGEIYHLGSAEVEVIDVGAEKENDSLVLLITYGKTKFLFTGDIEESAQERIAERYQNAGDTPFKIDLMKVPHHGAYANTFYRFLRTFMPDHAVISVGGGNPYGHPKERTLDMLEDADAKTYRTDKGGNIIVRSNGKTIEVETEK